MLSEAAAPELLSVCRNGVCDVQHIRIKACSVYCVLTIAIAIEDPSGIHQADASKISEPC